MLCSKFDLYSKSKNRVDVTELKPYYMGLINKVSADRAQDCKPAKVLDIGAVAKISFLAHKCFWLPTFCGLEERNQPREKNPIVSQVLWIR